MPHFPALNDLLNEVSLWADLRYEQRAGVARVLKRLQRELKRARKDLKNAEPKRRALAWEPNDLDAIRALRPQGPRQLWTKLETSGLADRMKGAWLGRAAGCTLGAPVEGWAIDAMERLARQGGMPFPPEDYWTTHPSPDVVRYGKSSIADYLKGGINAVPVDDDIT